MAHADMFPNEVLDSIVEQIGSRLSLPPGAGPSEVRETFSIWMLGLDATTKPDEPIGKLAKPTGRWHHQISVGGRSSAFARSMPLGPAPTDWSVTQTSTHSDIAEAIDKTIDWIDKNVKRDPLTRLLIVPAYFIHAFWLDYGETSSILIAHMPEQYTKLRYETLYTPKEFLELLAQEPHASGVPADFQQRRDFVA
jgi:hypothetical protein